LKFLLKKTISDDETPCTFDTKPSIFRFIKKKNEFCGAKNWRDESRPRCELQCSQCTLVIIQLRRINDGALRIVLIKLLRIADKSLDSTFSITERGIKRHVPGCSFRRWNVMSLE